MSTSLGYSLIEQTNNINNESTSNNIHEQRRKNKTLKKRASSETTNENVESMMKHLSSMSNQDDTEGLADFNPPDKPMSSGVERTKNSVSAVENFQSSDDNDDDEVSQENFQEANGAYAQQYYNQYVPYYANASNVKDSAGSNPEIMEKINYLVNLIENNNDEKVNSITEELVLYCFLGVFIIFIVDSFAKVGKYVR